MALSNQVKKAINMAILVAVAYFTVYVAKSVFSAITPMLLADGYTESYVAKISSLNFISYAIGQLVNGVLGDKIKAKYMLSLGLLLSGATLIVLPFVIQNLTLSMIIYTLTGYFLSMIYAPMTKVISENNPEEYAIKISLGYTFSSFLGSPVAGLLATLLAWQTVFYTSSAFLVIMGVVVFVVLLVYEKNGLVKYPKIQKEQKQQGNVKVLFKRQIIKFSLVSILTGIVRTSVVFWLPTYINQYLDFSPETSALIFTIASLALCPSAFIAVFAYGKLKRNLNLTLFLSFVLSAGFFLTTFLFKAPVFNIVSIVLAILFANCSSNLIWSVYCPGLYDTGMISSATGYLDFLSYLAAAIANLIFADAVSSIGWKSLILVWFLLMAFGVAISIPFKKLKTRKHLGELEEN